MTDEEFHEIARRVLPSNQEALREVLEAAEQRGQLEACEIHVHTPMGAVDVTTELKEAAQKHINVRETQAKALEWAADELRKNPAGMTKEGFSNAASLVRTMATRVRSGTSSLPSEVAS